MCHRLILYFICEVYHSFTASVLGSSVGSVSSYYSGPKIDPRVQNIFGANVSLSADSRRACCQLLVVEILVKCLRRLAKEECGSETDRRDIRGGPICNDVAFITPPTHLLDLLVQPIIAKYRRILLFVVQA